ncbi:MULTISPECIES: enoyl-CoA hydratase/isomerase family protein [unclassified Gordonia (in: high G+C Gram-positive bacteria)]|uniref:enoyl-CoA hydratase/isomerase family protein n=1 Tax=unclassified Gordonia (in: high G+C Gram-positive bacteria) TaxID=2657482 RepID=UPI00071D96E3|nr:MULTISPECIES: enoyl-CoA hydratase/isomerase family protein [unclassified Gordonia (in: high G+C Gram-positive bacteria)]KSU58790.1 enoyl-CoA hydratase [Gordonia sp. SGD-V-85]SCC14093.1 2-(1,2-epoxy-1,2-dihydrophenyl)acetyl-CoA isomerase [Gordonia sp. v-85]
MTTGLDFTIDDRGVAAIRLNRPEAANALDMDLADGLAAAVQTIESDGSVRVIRLSAAGRLFSGGGDVHGMATATDRGQFLAELAGSVHRSLIALDRLPVPVVAAVQGTAAGGGLGLVLAADVVIATPKTSFVAAYSTIGLSPDCGVSVNLPRTIGLGRALRMLVRNEKIDAATALEWGLVHEIVEAGELDEATDAVVALLLERPAAAIGHARRLARASYSRTYADHLDDEADTIAQLGAGEETAELLARFTR